MLDSEVKEGIIPGMYVNIYYIIYEVATRQKKALAVDGEVQTRLKRSLVYLAD
jgi:hypothetical protein